MKESIKHYFETNFNKKRVITKVIILAIAAVVVLIPSLSFYFWLRNKDPGTIIGANGFWFIHVKWNTGIGFSQLDGKTAAIFAIQSVVFVLLTCIFWFLVHDKVSCSFLSVAMFGGLFNLIQRACVADKAVLDYFEFGFWKNFAIFNWPDMFVVIGIFGFIITVIINLIRDSVNSHKEKVDQLPPPVPPQTPASGQA